MNASETFLYRVTQAIWYLFSLLETLLIVRFILRLFGANPDAAFTSFVYGISQVFVAPFQYVFGSPSVGVAVVDMSTLLALIMYWILAWGITTLIAMNREVDDIEASRELKAQDNHI